jgi:outer membrane biosynthesis protein TonB
VAAGFEYVRNAEFEIPPEARQQKIVGKVLVKFTIGPDGKVRQD